VSEGGAVLVVSVRIPLRRCLRLRLRSEQALREMTLEGVISILEDMNPHMMEIKLESFLVSSRLQKQGPVEVRREVA